MIVVSLAVGDECRRCRVPALPRPVVGVSPAAGDKPQPYRGRRCRRPVGDECRRCRVPALPRPVVGVPLAAGDKPQPYRGRRCRRRRRVPALLRPVVGVPLAAGDKPQPYRGRRCRRPVGDECRRYRVPALPRPVVGVSPAAGDKPQPYIRSAALPPAAGMSAGRCRGRRCRRRRGTRAGHTGGGVAAGRCRGFAWACRLSVFVRLFGNFEAHDNVARRPVLRATDRGGLGRPLSGGQ